MCSPAQDCKEMVSISMLHVVESRWIYVALWVVKNWEHFLLFRQGLILMYFSLSSFGCITKSVYARRSQERGGRDN